jgi:hypothetical protein
VSGKGSGIVRVTLSDRNTDPAGGVCKWCYNGFGADLELSTDWQEHCLKLDALRQQPGWGDPHPPALAKDGVFTLAWQVSSPGEAFDVWLDDVRLVCD